MKTPSPLLLLTTLSLFLLAPLSQAEDPLDATLREALYAEEVQGNADVALKAYTDVLTKLEVRRDLHATALFRQAECLRKLEKPTEAIAAYQKVMVLYPDLPRYAKPAAEALKSLGAAPQGAFKQEEPRIDANWQLPKAEIDRIAKESPDQLNDPQKALLFNAIKSENLAQIRYLLEKGCLADLDGNTPLKQATRQGSLAIAELLLSKGAKANPLGNGPMTQAVANNHSAMMKLLLSKGASADEPVEMKVGPHLPPIFPAVERGSEQMLQALLDAKAETNVFMKLENGLAASPLALAIIQGSGGKAAALAKAGADWKQKDENGNTLLHIVVTHASTANLFVEEILAQGVDVNAQNANGETALHLVASPTLAKCLLATSGIKALEDKQGQLPLERHFLTNIPVASLFLYEGAKFKDFSFVGSAISNRTSPLAYAAHAWSKVSEQYMEWFEQEGRRAKEIWLTTGIWGGPGDNRYMVAASDLPTLSTDSKVEQTLLSLLVKGYCHNYIHGDAVPNRLTLHKLGKKPQDISIIELCRNEELARTPLAPGDIVDITQFLNRDPNVLSETPGLIRQAHAKFFSKLEGKEVSDYHPSENSSPSKPAETPKPTKQPTDLPFGTPYIGKPGFVYSPYAPDKGLVDVSGIPSGTKVECPYTSKQFRAP